MPRFDIVSEVDMQRCATRSTRPTRGGHPLRLQEHRSVIELSETSWSPFVDRRPPAGADQVLDEKLVKRQVSLKAFEDAKLEEAQKGTSRQKIAIRAGISRPRQTIEKFIKEPASGRVVQTQG